MAVRNLQFVLSGKDSGASKAFAGVGRSADDAEKKTHRLGNKLKGFGKLAAGIGAGAAVAGVAGFAAAVKGGVEELADNQKSLAQFQAGIKSTGGAAKVSADEMQALANSIEAKTGTDAAAVVSGGALLSTFLKVRNEAGKGNDVFSRATQAGVDLAARGFGSVESNAILLGKALNDPVKGLTALGKQGVTFTAEQKKTIKGLVETGDTLSAQKIILKEIEGQVGGSAEAYGKTLPGQLARAGHAFDGVKENLAKAFVPAMTGALDGANKFFNGLTGNVEIMATKDRPLLEKFGMGIGAVIGAFKEGDKTSDGFIGKMEDVGIALRGAWKFIKNKIVPALKDLAGWFGEQLVPIISKFVRYLRDTVFPALGDLARWFGEQVLPKIKALAEYLATKVIPIVADVVGSLIDGLRGALDKVKQGIEDNRPQLEKLVGAFQALVKFIVEKVVPVLGPVLETAFKGIGTGVAIALDVVGVLVEGFQSMFSFILRGVATSIEQFRRLATAGSMLPGPLQDDFRAAAIALGVYERQVIGARNAVDAFGNPVIPAGMTGVNELATVSAEKRTSTQPAWGSAGGGGGWGSVQVTNVLDGDVLSSRTRKVEARRVRNGATPVYVGGR